MKVIITGATGFVGRGVLMECLSDERVTQILSISRKPTGIQHSKLEEYIIPDFMSIRKGDERLTGYDACLYCAGISSVGMKEPEYTLITYDTTMHFATSLLPAPQMTFIYVSGAGTRTDEKGMMWTRVKGKTENELLKLPFKQAFMFRPGIMKAHKGQVNIPKLQRITTGLYPILRIIMPGMANTLEQVGKAMIEAARNGYQRSIIEAKDITVLSQKSISL